VSGAVEEKKTRSKSAASEKKRTAQKKEQIDEVFVLIVPLLFPSFVKF
jgi:hypothetical protein